MQVEEYSLSRVLFRCLSSQVLCLFFFFLLFFFCFSLWFLLPVKIACERDFFLFFFFFSFIVSLSFFFVVEKRKSKKKKKAFFFFFFLACCLVLCWKFIIYIYIFSFFFFWVLRSEIVLWSGAASMCNVPPVGLRLCTKRRKQKYVRMAWSAVLISNVEKWVEFEGSSIWSRGGFPAYLPARLFFFSSEWDWSKKRRRKKKGTRMWAFKCKKKKRNSWPHSNVL